jgi:hypothetical protein
LVAFLLVLGKLSTALSIAYKPEAKSHNPRSSIKGEVKKKHICFGRSFSCFPAHWIERDLF